MKLHIFMHSLHGKSLPLIFLIIIPLFFYTFFTFFFAYVLSFYFGVVGNYELYLNVRDYATYTLFVLLFLVYGLYPYKLSSKEYFDKVGNSNLAIEYEFLKKIIYALLPIAIAATILIATVTTYKYNETLLTSNTTQIKIIYTPLVNNITSLTKNVPIFGVYVPKVFDNYLNYKDVVDPMIRTSQAYSFIILYATLFRIFIRAARKEYRYHLSIGYFELCSELHERTERAGYINKGLHSYDKFLKRIFNFQIKNIKVIQQKIAFADTEKLDRLLSLISEESSDRLALLGNFVNFYTYEMMKS